MPSAGQSEPWPESLNSETLRAPSNHLQFDVTVNAHEMNGVRRFVSMPRLGRPLLNPSLFSRSLTTARASTATRGLPNTRLSRAFRNPESLSG